MATRFWVPQNGTLTWAITTPTNWGSASGVADNQSVPGIGDIAVFDGGSGTGNSIIAANITVQGLECDGSTLGTGTYGGTITHNTNVTLTINTGAANSLRFASGMVYTPASTTSIVTLTHTSGTANIKTYGKAFSALTINGAGGTTQLLDDLKVNAILNSILTVTSGIFDANNGAGGPYAITACLFAFSGSVTRSVILGGTVTIGGNVSTAQSVWSSATQTGLTFTKNSANIVILPPVSPVGLWTFAAALTLNNVTLNASSTQTDLNITQADTFANLSVGSGWNLCFGNTITHTVSNAFSITGTPANPTLIFTTGPGNVGTLSVPSGAVTLNWGGIRDITASGGATFTATNTLNFGNNTGWSISPPADSTAVLTAAEVTTLGRMIDGVALGTVAAGATTTSVPTSALAFGGVAASGVVADEFKGRVIEFSGTTTTAGLRGAVAQISANTASNTPTFTVGTLPATPAAGDIFSVI